MAAALITDELYARLLANGARSAAGEDIDPRPVVKFFTPDAGATWLLTEADPEDPDRLFGLCDPRPWRTRARLCQPCRNPHGSRTAPASGRT